MRARPARLPWKRLSRGAAITEFALVAPLLVTLLLFSMYFTEIIRAKLKLQEASRYVAFEMTSYTLTDYGSSAPDRHRKAFDLAKGKVAQDALDRFKDLDSVDDRPAGNFVVGYQDVRVRVDEQQVALAESPVSNALPVGGPIAQGIANAINGGSNWFFNRFGFNTRGQVQVELTGTIESRYLPRNFLNDRGFFSVDQWGGSNLQSMRLRNRFTLIATGWHLPDGSDAVMTKDGNDGGPRAGLHGGGSDHGLYLQTKRMVNLGVTNDLSAIPGFDLVMNVLSFVGPNPFDSTFVVAHNYGLASGGDRGCNSDPGHDFDTQHQARGGMNNLLERSSLDHDRRKCYDTAPFRDQTSYQDSHYASIFRARGPYFMGCENPEADDPTEVGRPSSTRGDKNNKVKECEVP